jgi:hypothetical protein
MDVKEWGQILSQVENNPPPPTHPSNSCLFFTLQQNLGSPLSLLSHEIQIVDSIPPPVHTLTGGSQLVDSMQLINRSLSKSMEILPTRSPNSCV